MSAVPTQTNIVAFLIRFGLVFLLPALVSPVKVLRHFLRNRPTVRYINWYCHDRWRCRWCYVAVVALAIGTGPLVRADDGAPVHEHPILSVDPKLSLTAVIDHTIKGYPATIELTAQTKEANAWSARGRGWLADSPALTFRYQSDRLGDNNRLEEYESGIQLPLWRWGAKRATRDLGESMAMAASNNAVALRWSVAGQVRTALWVLR